MKRLVLIVSALALAYAVSTPARADFAIAKFNDGWCRVWVDTAYKPMDGKYLWWRYHHHLHYRLGTWKSGDWHLAWALKHHRCKHW